jgi:hypothetical protein
VAAYLAGLACVLDPWFTDLGQPLGTCGCLLLQGLRGSWIWANLWVPVAAIVSRLLRGIRPGAHLTPGSWIWANLWVPVAAYLAGLACVLDPWFTDLGQPLGTCGCLFLRGLRGSWIWANLWVPVAASLAAVHCIWASTVPPVCLDLGQPLGTCGCLSGWPGVRTRPLVHGSGPTSVAVTLWGQFSSIFDSDQFSFLLIAIARVFLSLLSRCGTSFRPFSIRTGFPIL